MARDPSKWQGDNRRRRFEIQHTSISGARLLPHATLPAGRRLNAILVGEFTVEGITSRRPTWWYGASCALFKAFGRRRGWRHHIFAVWRLAPALVVRAPSVRAPLDHQCRDIPSCDGPSCDGARACPSRKWVSHLERAAGSGCGVVARRALEQCRRHECPPRARRAPGTMSDGKFARYVIALRRLSSRHQLCMDQRE